VEHYIEDIVLDYFTMAIYYLLPAALSNKCNTREVWDKKWMDLSGQWTAGDSDSTGVTRMPTLPKTIVWSFVLGNQSSGKFLPALSEIPSPSTTPPDWNYSGESIVNWARSNESIRRSDVLIIS
jgi:hypothetical protein